MPLIDRSYFINELTLPKTDTPAVQELLDGLIQKREPEWLRAVMGYPLFKAFMAGLALDPIEPRMADILNGAEYTDRFGNLMKWDGLVSGPIVLLRPVDESTRIPVVADQPSVDSQTILVPTNMVGRSWTVSKRPIGDLRTDEYDISDDGASVAFSSPVVLGDTYFFYSNDLSLEQSVGDTKLSPIAGYVYYWYMRQRASNTTDLGEVVGTSENSVVNGPAIKQMRAWNEMCEQVKVLLSFLYYNQTVYPEWKWQDGYRVTREFSSIPWF